MPKFYKTSQPRIINLPSTDDAPYPVSIKPGQAVQVGDEDGMIHESLLKNPHVKRMIEHGILVEAKSAEDVAKEDEAAAATPAKK